MIYVQLIHNNQKSITILSSNGNGYKDTTDISKQNFTTFTQCRINHMAESAYDAGPALLVSPDLIKNNYQKKACLC